MKGLAKKLETMFAAAAFAEEGDFNTARELLGQEQPQKTDRISPAARSRKELRAPGIQRQ